MTIVQKIQAATGVRYGDWLRVTGSSSSTACQMSKESLIEIRILRGSRFVFQGDQGKKVLRAQGLVMVEKLKRTRSVMVGRRYAALTVVGDTGRTNVEGKKLWQCQCECGNEVEAVAWKLKQGYTTSCGCGTFPSKNPTPVISSTGYGELTAKRWGHIIAGAETRKLAITVDSKHVWELFLAQNRRCALSGVPLKFDSPTTASLDRKDSKQGYIPGNLQWVHKTLNLMKMALSDEEFIRWCRTVAAHQGAVEEVRCRLGGDEHATVTSNSLKPSGLSPSVSSGTGNSNELNPLREQHISNAVEFSHV